MESLATQLNRILWEEGHSSLWDCDPNVKVVACGGRDAHSGDFKGAEVWIEGRLCRGTVVFSDAVAPSLCCDEAIMHIVPEPSPQCVYLSRGEKVYQMVATPQPELLDLFGELIEWRHSPSPTLCSEYISALDDVKRIQLLLRLFADRSERKHRQEVQMLLDESRNDWNYAMYVTLFKAAGGAKYKAPYMELARRVPYTAVAHEKSSPLMVEAMLTGASGLLARLRDDDYIVELKQHFDYLCRKYDIVPMYPSQWDAQKSSGDMPYGFPLVRIAQISMFLCNREFIFDGVVKCRTRQDVYNLLRTEISGYWAEKVKSTRLEGLNTGTDFMDRMGINFVAPIMFCFGQATGDEKLAEAAQDLMDGIPAENNRIIRLWRGRGVKVLNASDSQAMLELNNEYCLRMRCGVCPVGRRILKRRIETTNAVYA